MNERPHRKIRSFVRRPGRTTDAQRKALERLMPKYGIEYGERLLDLASIFGRDASVVLDIGFGNGEALVTLAAGNPETDYLGVEIHEPGIGRLLLLLERAELTNVRVVEADAVEVVSNMLADASL
ncbi:MAG TPA: tRNA (guanosine(46)-N7)-methyltransferase TrmB, partial [Gammaproteobacteria bacterium]